MFHMGKLQFNEDAFSISYKAMNSFPQIVEWLSQPTDIPGAGASFTSSILQRRDSPDEPWRYVASVSMTYYNGPSGDDDDKQTAERAGTADTMKGAIKLIKKFIIRDLNTPREVDPADTYQDVDSSGRAYDWDIENFTDTSHYIDQPEIGGWKHPDEM